MQPRNKAIDTDVKVYILDNGELKTIGAIVGKNFVATKGGNIKFIAELKKEDSANEYGVLNLINDLNNGITNDTFVFKVCGKPITQLVCESGYYHLVSAPNQIALVEFFYTVSRVLNYKDE